MSEFLDVKRAVPLALQGAREAKPVKALAEGAAQ